MDEDIDTGWDVVRSLMDLIKQLQTEKKTIVDALERAHTTECEYLKRKHSDEIHKLRTEKHQLQGYVDQYQRELAKRP